jgi:ABC-type multidrug transport system fused ATPase/permease subunit
LNDASWDTYAKILSASGGMFFWIPFGLFVVANVFVWEQNNGYWTRFADKSPEE